MARFIKRDAEMVSLCLTSCVPVLAGLCLILVLSTPKIVQGASYDRQKQEGALKTTTKEAFEKVEPKILALKPGTPIEISGLSLGWGSFIETKGFLKKESVVVDVWAQSDGWIGILSGGTKGAMDKIGAPAGRSGNVVYGEHVYGYVWEKATVIPRYLVRTQADIISKTEYERALMPFLKKEGPAVGRFQPPGEKEVIYCGNITIRDVIPLSFSEPPKDGYIKDPAFDPSAYAKKLMSPESYQEMESKLNALPKGIVDLEVVRRLDGIIASRDLLLKDYFILGVKGLLNGRSDWAWSTMTPQGIFTVWSFGYMEDRKEIPKSVLISKTENWSRQPLMEQGLR